MLSLRLIQVLPTESFKMMVMWSFSHPTLHTKRSKIRKRSYQTLLTTINISSLKCMLEMELYKTNLTLKFNSTRKPSHSHRLSLILTGSNTHKSSRRHTCSSLSIPCISRTSSFSSKRTLVPLVARILCSLRLTILLITQCRTLMTKTVLDLATIN